MAYRRPTYRRTRRSTRRYAPRKTYSTRRSRPTYRRTYRKRRVMSTRRVLNITTTKKRDIMASYTNVVIPRNDGNTTYTADAALLQAYTGTTKNVYSFLWCATARSSTTSPEETDRNDSRTYMRGLKERIEIQTSSGAPWQWRRICFSKKGSFYPVSTTFAPYYFTSNGYTRTVNQVPTGYLATELFDGGQNKDWLDLMSARTNRRLITVHYDKTISLQSGNASGVLQVFNRWHPMNKTLLYQEEESGGDTSGAVYATQGRIGMGDYYVVDIFQSGGGATATDQLSFMPQATLFWHEK
uniref:Capsid protein n=1 Tax=Genomoviridae sp. TaxID=2202565 RepID=A0A858NGC5_9VIRU|nr:MAG: capsid protein [Genomoviridae sp.]